MPVQPTISNIEATSPEKGSVRLNFQVTNNGDAGEITFKYGGDEPIDDKIGSQHLESGETHTVLQNWDVVKGGTFKMYVDLSAGGEEFGKKTDTVEVEPVPYFEFTSIGMDYADDGLEMLYVVKNAGGAEGTQDVQYGDYNGDITGSDELTLLAGEYRSKRVNLGDIDPSGKTLWVVSDGYLEFSPEPLPYYEITDSQATSPAPGELTLSYTIENVSGTGGVVPVSYGTQNGEVSGSHEVALDPGESKTMTETLDGVSPGEYTTSVDIYGGTSTDTVTVGQDTAEEQSGGAGQVALPLLSAGVIGAVLVLANRRDNDEGQKTVS